MASKEYLAGFWIIEAPDLDVVLKLATEASKACNRKARVRNQTSCSNPIRVCPRKSAANSFLV